MPEGLNPTRPYKHFRPRQAYRGQATLTAVNNASIALFNGPNSRNYVIVRYFTWITSTTTTVLSAHQRGIYGALAMKGVPIMVEGAAPAAQVNTLDTATLISGDGAPAFVNNPYGWEQDFPYSILPPQCSLILQDQTIGHTARAMFLWEEIDADELDFLFVL